MKKEIENRGVESGMMIGINFKVKRAILKNEVKNWNKEKMNT